MRRSKVVLGAEARHGGQVDVRTVVDPREEFIERAASGSTFQNDHRIEGGPLGVCDPDESRSVDGPAGSTRVGDETIETGRVGGPRPVDVNRRTGRERLVVVWPEWPIASGPRFWPTFNPMSGHVGKYVAPRDRRLERS